MIKQNDISLNNDIRFEALFNSASLGIIVVNNKGTIVLANHFANQLFKYTSKSMEGEMLEKLIPQRYHHNHIGHREGYASNPKARVMGIGMSLSAIKNDGTVFPVEVSLGHFKIQEEPYVLAYIADITKRKQNEEQIILQKADLELINEEMRKLNANLEAKVNARTFELQNTLNALEAYKEELTTSLEKEKVVNDLKSRFVSMASHEFRTPLSTILSSISLLAKYNNSEDQPKRDRHIDRIKSSVKTLTDILNEFLSLGKIEEGKVEVNPEQFDLSEFISDLIDDMNVLLKSNQSIQYKHIGIPNTFLDSTLLKHVMVNLLSNAIKFSPEKAIITIETKIETEVTYIKINDQGIGIPMADQVHLFERFFRASNVTNIQGTGLGLHIVGRYIELLNGEIKYTSELEKGSTFTITLPNKINNGFYK
jgi:PAS domain S-box-containing protein